jgi:hypothetical protein
MEKVVQVGGPNGFVVRKVVVPPIPVDCTEFRDPTDGEWVAGKFVKNNLLVPPVVVDCAAADPAPLESSEEGKG